MSGKKRREELFADLKPQYTAAEADEAIGSLLREYGEDCVIRFRRTNAEILGSYKVRSPKTRAVICEILARSGVTARSSENLAAEWRLHNVSYRLGFMRSHARDVSLDYNKDPHFIVRLLSDIFDLLDWE